jgi:ATP-dependent RNA helicase HelY
VWIPSIQPRVDPRLREILASIGKPEPAPFEPDPFQLEALSAVQGADCLVTAPTGAGKTWIAEQAIARLREAGGKSWYASPLKALTNSKYAEFSATFGPKDVGILTGDRKENPEAPIVVGTTEILRNQLYDAMHLGEDLATDFVVLDEAHFMGDRDRGVVWEEVMIYLPPRIPLLLLSATIGNAQEIAAWLSSVRHRECIVVEETERPVDLCPLFFHPSGTLLPLLARSRGAKTTALDKKVWSYLRQKNPPRLSRSRELPPFGEIIRVLRRFDLLPAIFFLKSRADCDRALDLCLDRSPRLGERLSERLDELMDPFIARHRQLELLKRRGVGAHHAGQLPTWKLLLETLMTDGLLDAIFATSTVAAGVNFPARTVVFLNSDRFDGNAFVPLSPTEFHQMIGRAGRRGMDRIGFAIVLPGEYMDVEAIAILLASSPSDVLSQVQISFSMVLNLLLSHTPEQVEGLLERSFSAYRAKGRHRYLVRAFRRHVVFLREKGYVAPDGSLTEEGRWASQLRVDQPLLIAEGLRLGILPSSDPALLAAALASFVGDRDEGAPISEALYSRELERTFVILERGLKVLARHMSARGFECTLPALGPAATMYAWASGRTWREVIGASGIAEGDLAMLVSRTADNLRHVQTLSGVFPQMASTARRAVESIVREPVAP